MKKENRYHRIIEEIFFKSYRKGLSEVPFEREDILLAAEKLRIRLPKNIGDLIYSFRYRVSLPESVVKEAPRGQAWVIRPRGRAKYAFVAASLTTIVPSPSLAETKVPDATPGMIVKYALDDEQGLLARLRYNRLIDVFTGITCYSL
ncbi:MAG: endonuclease [uncultured bacterium]|nr:MAG: endonuclease [uncultured bacterium]